MPKYTRVKRFGIGRSYSVCVVGASVWAFVQFVSILLVSFGLADGNLWWLTTLVNCLKFAAMLVFAVGVFCIYHNVAPEKKQVSGIVLFGTTVFTVICSLLRLFLLKACYGGFNTFGKSLVLVVIAVMLINYRKKPPYVENLWKYAGITATFCYIAAVLMALMLFSLQLIEYTFAQYVYTFTFYVSEGCEVIVVTMLVVYYLGRKRLVRARPEN